MRRLLIVPAGVLVAAVAGLVFMGVALLVDGAMLQAGTRLAALGVSSLIAAQVGDAAASHLAGDAVMLAWATAVAVCFAPVAVAALLGEAVGTRAFVWYAGVSGGLAAAVPTLTRSFGLLPERPSASGAAIEARLTPVFFLTGVVTGFVYWMLAGRGADGRLARTSR